MHKASHINNRLPHSKLNLFCKSVVHCFNFTSQIQNNIQKQKQNTQHSVRVAHAVKLHTHLVVLHCAVKMDI